MIYTEHERIFLMKQTNESTVWLVDVGATVGAHILHLVNVLWCLADDEHSEMIQ